MKTLRQTIIENVSHNFKEFRRLNGLKQSDMIRKLQTNRTSYGAYEEKRCMPPADVLVRFSELSGISINDLLTTKVL